MQSDVSQKEKDQYSILTHMYGIQKDGNDDMRQQKKHRYKEQIFGLCGRRQAWNDIALKHVYYHM